MSARFRTREGFTLVELSIVLVVVGLIAGGIVASQGLLQNAQRTRLYADLDAYMTAQGIFLKKYNALPGDMADATTRVSAATANGNGNGLISEPPDEVMLYWQHLSLAGMIGGRYSGVSVTTNAVPGENVPVSVIDGVDLEIDAEDSSQSGWAGGTPPIWGNHFTLGSRCTAWTHYTDCAPGISPDLSVLIDRKYDDGKPTTGTVRAAKNHGGNCFNAGTGVYNQNSAVGCALGIYFRTYSN